MKTEYDRETDGAYIWLTDGPKLQIVETEIWPQEFNEEVGFLLDHKRKIVGIEFLPASSYLANELLKDTYSDS